MVHGISCAVRLTAVALPVPWPVPVGCVGCGEVEFSRLVLSSPSCVEDGHHLVRATSSRRRTAHAT